MANRTFCSYNANIKCDLQYELDEFYRQMKLALESGELTTFRTGTDRCPCKKDLCPRCLAAQKQR
ncbi:hypothetical protein HDR61_02840 [bacterium]|nr:hypothetical protein [bacterium]